MPKRDPKPWDEMTAFEKGVHAAWLRAEMKLSPAPRLQREDVMAILESMEEPEFQVRPGTLGPGDRCPRGCRGRR